MGGMINHIAQHHCSSRCPGRQSQRGKIGFHDVVTIASRPTAGGVPVWCGHLYIGCQQIIATVRFIICTVNEMLRMKALPHQATLHIYDYCHHRIDSAIGSRFFQRFETQVTRHRLLRHYK